MFKLPSKRLTVFVIIGVAIFMLSGMLDYSSAIASAGKVPMESPLLSAFSPVALMLCIFGFLGVWFLIEGARNFNQEKETLAKRQIDTGFMLLLATYGLYEVVLRVPLIIK
jgi:succinate dehydrogenase/fumarate reductase cytochrome b subunit